jgi:hypothetical protein
VRCLAGRKCYVHGKGVEWFKIRMGRMHDRWHWHMRLPIHDLYCLKLSLLLLAELSVNHTGTTKTNRSQSVIRWSDRCTIWYCTNGRNAPSLKTCMIDQKSCMYP